MGVRARARRPLITAGIGTRVHLHDETVIRTRIHGGATYRARCTSLPIREFKVLRVGPIDKSTIPAIVHVADLWRVRLLGHDWSLIHREAMVTKRRTSSRVGRQSHLSAAR